MPPSPDRDFRLKLLNHPGQLGGGMKRVLRT
jgi:hypothetical protein